MAMPSTDTDDLARFGYIDSVIAITVCSLAVHTGGIRMIFTMGRDGRLPFASAIARVHGKSKTPLVPSLVIGALTIGLLVLNVGNQRAFFVLTSVAIIMFYIAYLCVTVPLLIARMRGKWPSAEHGPYFSLGRWGLPVNLLAHRGRPTTVLAEHRSGGAAAGNGAAGHQA